MNYHSDIYFNCFKRVYSDTPFYFFNIFIGARGTGKTYSMLKGAVENNITFMYLRRTQTELDNCCSVASNPFKAINRDCNFDISIKSNKDNALIVNQRDDEVNVVGYAAALSTFGKFRGADFSDVDLIIFDEFINTSAINTIKNESNYLFNLIETVGRNREIEGKEPLKIVLLSNANTLDSDIIRSLKLADIIKKMKEDDSTVYTDDERSIYIELVQNTGITDLKAKTALYKLTKNTTFYEMALNNEFTSEFFGDTKQLNYKEFTPVVAFNGMYFYKHKSKDLIYVSNRKAECDSYDLSSYKKFMRNYGFMIKYYIDSAKIIYANYDIKLNILNIV